MFLREYRLKPDDLLDFKEGELLDLIQQHKKWIAEAQRDG